MSRKLVRVACNLAFAIPMALIVVAPVGAADTFDGIYRGGQTTLRTNNSKSCANMDRPNAEIVVQNNHFTRKWGEAGELSVDVAANGSFNASLSVAGERKLRSATITGTISGGVLDAEIGTDLCAAHLSLKKS